MSRKKETWIVAVEEMDTASGVVTRYYGRAYPSFQGAAAAQDGRSRSMKRALPRRRREFPETGTERAHSDLRSASGDLRILKPPSHEPAQ